MWFPYCCLISTWWWSRMMKSHAVSKPSSAQLVLESCLEFVWCCCLKAAWCCTNAMLLFDFAWSWSYEHELDAVNALLFEKPLNLLVKSTWLMFGCVGRGCLTCVLLHAAAHLLLFLVEWSDWMMSHCCCLLCFGSIPWSWMIAWLSNPNLCMKSPEFRLPLAKVTVPLATANGNISRAPSKRGVLINESEYYTFAIRWLVFDH